MAASRKSWFSPVVVLFALLTTVLSCGDNGSTEPDPPPTITTTSLPGGTTGQSYSQPVAATGGTQPYAWSISSGSLPNGLGISSSTGVISGTPTAAGTSSFTVQVTSGAGQTATKELSITIANPAPVITTTSLPDGVVGTAYSQTLAATGGDGSYTWSITSGSLPTGLALSSEGLISGTPTAAGTSNFTVQATSAGQTATKALSITINAGLSVTTTTLADGVVGTAYSETLAAAGGDGSYTWAVSVGSLPAGLSLAASTGVISGTPTSAGTSTFTIRVTDGNSLTDTLNLSITIGNPVLQPSELCSDHPGGAIATFEDANLEAAIRAALSVGTQGDLTCALLSGVVELGAEGAEIESLMGIQNLTNLTDLRLGENSIADISAVSGLTSLENLDLSDNSITDLTPLSELTSLWELWISNNRISDLSALSGLTSLTDLLLDKNSITDISALSGLISLEVLDLETNSITDIRALSGLTSLTELILFDNTITDISALSGLTSLEGLELAKNQITDVSALSGLTSLTELWIDDNAITDISALSGLTSLTELDLRANTITDISALSGLTSLTELNLADNAISNIGPLLNNAGLGAGAVVWLTGNPVNCVEVAALSAKGVTVHSDCL